MTRLIVDNGVRITHADNPNHFHVWPADHHDPLGEARKVALAWEDDELVGLINAIGTESAGEHNVAEAPKSKRGRPPKASA